MNKNCLEGKKCPQCGKDDELLVRCGMWVSLTDGGTDPFSDSVKHMCVLDYDGNSPVECPSCGHTGKLGEWDTKEGPTAQMEAMAKQVWAARELVAALRYMTLDGDPFLKLEGTDTNDVIEAYHKAKEVGL